jgi:glycosyltransferase involved in cell wall biosynthesis
MDNDAHMTIYGNQSLPEGTADRPPVTFAVFAYNQEKYIREAVEGAFSQTYSPLEIILSDDCSSDQTFEIMREMAEGYEGPHKIIVRSNAFNLGTALHVQSAFSVAKGQLFVVAAGDDISKPNRVRVLVDAWIVAGCPEGVIHSGRESFRDDKSVALEPAKRHRFSDCVLEGYARAYWLPAAAPTCAYTRGVFERFGPLIGGSIIEDAPLQLRAALIGEFIACDQSLLYQRLHDSNNGTAYNVDAPARWNRFIQSKMIAFRTMQIDLSHWNGELDPDLKRRIEGRILAVLSSTSGLLLPETRVVSGYGRVRVALRIVAAPAIARSFRLRLEYAFSFLGFNFHRRVKGSLRRLTGRQRRDG